MTWKSHRITTFAILYALTGNPVPAAVATLSCTLPDRMEAWWMKHRGITHWPVIPVALMFLLYWHISTSTSIGASYLILYVVMGYVCHIFEDLLSRSGVPLLTPGSHPVGLDLYKTKTLSELAAVLMLLSVSGLIALQKGFLSVAYVTELPNLSLRTVAALLGIA